jgi:hypothetical protein
MKPSRWQIKQPGIRTGSVVMKCANGVAVESPKARRKLASTISNFL